MRRFDHAEAYDLRATGRRVKDLAAEYGVTTRSIHEALDGERMRRIKSARANGALRITPDATPVFVEREDGWHGYFKSLHVGPFPDPEGYTRATVALDMAINGRLIPTEG